MTGPLRQVSPMNIARLGGSLYLIVIAIGIFGEAIVRGQLIVAGDAAATFQNIQESMLLWRVSVATELVLVLCATALAYVFYTLLKRVNREIALAILIFNITAIGLEAANRFNLFSVLILVENRDYRAALGEQQLFAQIQLALDSYNYGFGASLAVFGVECMMIGYLVYHSRFLPKFIGIMMAIAGTCYVTSTFLLVLTPTLFDALFPGILIPCFLGELTFALWLLLKGVDLREWERRGE